MRIIENYFRKEKSKYAKYVKKQEKIGIDLSKKSCKIKETNRTTNIYKIMFAFKQREKGMKFNYEK